MPSKLRGAECSTTGSAPPIDQQEHPTSGEGRLQFGQLIEQVVDSTFNHPHELPIAHVLARDDAPCASSSNWTIGLQLGPFGDCLPVAAQVVHDWRLRYPEFPEPVAKLKTALVWAWPDVEAWARATGRLKG